MVVEGMRILRLVKPDFIQHRGYGLGIAPHRLIDVCLIMASIFVSFLRLPFSVTGIGERSSLLNIVLEFFEPLGGP
jgi:hypothetical protein